MRVHLGAGVRWFPLPAQKPYEKLPQPYQNCPTTIHSTRSPTMAPTSDNRYSSTHMLFEVDKDIRKSEMSEYASSNGLNDLIVLNPSVTGTNRHRCYGTRLCK
ncbi:hypothetical protein RRG08_062884 [Elysia crispata]|uniref:Uncharacterized protein n=1 Tax=Elysia crispata TaxID=231223 RepID=A0AAE1B9X9_9GAST|nr:hypothetical protein RRG08_062884 [Elysia crispata]